MRRPTSSKPRPSPKSSHTPLQAAARSRGRWFRLSKLPRPGSGRLRLLVASSSSFLNEQIWREYDAPLMACADNLVHQFKKRDCEKRYTKEKMEENGKWARAAR